MKVFDPAQINGLNYINNKEHEALKYLSKHYPEIVANWQRGINKLGKQYKEWFNKGHEIGNHTYTHPINFGYLDKKQIYEEIIL